MKPKQKYNLPLDRFINLSLYDNKFGYYMKKNPFGNKGDFITAPNISRLFSEMIAIWILSFWQSLGCPKKFNLIELGAGNGEMMKVLIESFKNFPVFFKSCNFIINEKSPLLKKIQKKTLVKTKTIWISNICKTKNIPSVFIANEFFDALPIKQFFKKENQWFQKFVSINHQNKGAFINRKFNMNKLEKKLNFKISKNQNFIEYSELSFDYLKNISKIIKKNDGGLLLIDYGYTQKRMKNTLQAISKHKFVNILDNIGDVDITHNLSFELFKNFVKKIGGLTNDLTTQRKFLINMGIRERAEMISKNKNFLKKADIYYRLERLIDEKQMGNLFKFMLIKNNKNKFKLGF
jgi:cyclopropane-fatty-acyl-phospholipid synthase